LSHFHARVRHTQDGRTVVHLAGAATFVRLPELTAALEAIADGREVHVHLEDLDYSDHASMEALMAWERQYQARGGRVYLSWDRLEFLAMAPAERLLAANGGGKRDDSGTMSA
jgi:MFS superfamily sulfate permease-like transporter